MKNLQFAWIVASTTIMSTCLFVIAWTLTAPPPTRAMAAVMAAVNERATISPARSAMPDVISRREPSPSPEVTASIGAPEKDQTCIEEKEETFAPRNNSCGSPRRKSRMFRMWLTSISQQAPPDRKPADMHHQLNERYSDRNARSKNIRRAADGFRLGFQLYENGCQGVESNVRSQAAHRVPTLGLFQLNKYEFNKYGSGEITNHRAIMPSQPAYKFVTEATLFEWENAQEADFQRPLSDPSTGLSRALLNTSAEPDRIAWKSMCATDEGRKKKASGGASAPSGGNTHFPPSKKIWKSVEKLPSGEFVEHVAPAGRPNFYTRYSEAKAADTKQ